MLEPVRKRLEEFAEELKKTAKVQTGFRQKYGLMAMGQGLVRVKIELYSEVCNLGEKTFLVAPKMDVDEADKPVFEACQVVLSTEQWKIGADLLTDSGRPRVVRAIGPQVSVMEGERASVLWRYSIEKKVDDRDIISFGNVTVGPVVVEYEPTLDFVFFAESLNPYQVLNNGWEWGGCFMKESHVNICWRPVDEVVESEAIAV